MMAKEIARAARLWAEEADAAGEQDMAGAMYRAAHFAQEAADLYEHGYLPNGGGDGA